MIQIEMIPYIKDCIKSLESKDENDYHNVMMYFHAVYANYNLLITDKFESLEDYNFYKEFINRSHDYLLSFANEVSNKNPSLCYQNYLPIRIVLASMLFGIEKRDKNLI